ncbi:MAG TPA: hypothetical protein VMS31_17565 [Pyrinomonadaceae bacterium]|nr:hypothetical protein [Pyrinomonadaceae bacterium]
MSRVRNAEDFLQEYRRIRFQYDDLYLPRIEAIRASYSDNPAGSTPPSVDNALEAHLREYVVNAFLRSLNWRMDVSVEDGLPNLIPEVPIASSSDETTKFLDYLGTERGGSDPLLIVESKRPRSPLPKRKAASGKSSATAMADESLGSIISAGLGGTELTGDWNEWLDTLRDYVQSAYDQRGKVPHRVVLTSGRWLIIFTDPANSFLSGGTRDPEKILVFTAEGDDEGNRDLIEQNYGEIFNWLENQRVLDEIPPLTVAEVTFYINPDDIHRILHGLQVLYIEQPDFHEGPSVALSVSPIIRVMPIIFLHSRFGAWLRVYSDRKIAIPHDDAELANHLKEVDEIAAALLEDINRRVGTNFTPETIESHFKNPDDFDVLRGVVEKAKDYPHYDERVVVTGQYTRIFVLNRPFPIVRTTIGEIATGRTGRFLFLFSGEALSPERFSCPVKPIIVLTGTWMLPNQAKLRPPIGIGAAQEAATTTTLSVSSGALRSAYVAEHVFLKTVAQRLQRLRCRVRERMEERMA